MYELATNSIRTVNTIAHGAGHVLTPGGVSCVCHACGDSVVFNLSNPVVDRIRKSTKPKIIQ